MKLLDLFSGIGGFSLGLERAGFKTIAFCEINPFCRRVLAKHWPEVPCYEDIRTLTGTRLATDGIVPDAICGGFPCQDISVAGRGAGLSGERSGLWFDYARIIGEVRPRWIIIENVPALRSRGLDTVLGALAAFGYDAEWHCIPASAIGARHRRDRLWIVAYAVHDRYGKPVQQIKQCRGGIAPDAGSNGAVFDVADPIDGHSSHRNGEQVWPRRTEEQSPGCSAAGADTSRTRLALGEGTIREWAHAATSRGGWWEAEPDVGRVVDGISDAVDRRSRLTALGNSVVPQIPEMIGRAIMRAEAMP